MKGMDISCVSPASTAVCHSTTTSTTATADRRPSSATSSSSASSSLTIEQHLGGRAIDRHNPIIADSRRAIRSLTLPAPCTSSMPISPVPYHQLRPNAKKRNSFSYSSKKENLPTKQGSRLSPPRPSPHNIFSRSFSCSSDPVKKKLDAKHVHGDFKSPPGSSRYLLSEANSVEANPTDQSFTAPKPELSNATVGSKSVSEQLVVLRVSLHCKGCEGKVRKHLSRMPGVTSFNIDFAAKKVTVFGDVTPDGVLSSVSRVKNAQFWTSPVAVTHNIKQ